VALAAEKYGLNFYTARNYLREYKSEVMAAEKSERKVKEYSEEIHKVYKDGKREFKNMSRDELIMEIISLRMNEARLKKGYEKKGGGRKKAYRDIIY